MPDAPPPLRLRCLGGEAPPPELVTDLRLLAGFSPAALGALWSVLGPCLTEPIPPRMAAALDAFADKYGIEGDSLARAVRACRALVRGAALLDLPGDVLAEDARALSGPDAPAADLLLRGYDAAKAQIRAVAVRAALLEHGRVLDGIDWRLDHVVASSAGGRLRFPVVVLTLRSQHQGKFDALTLQVTPEQLGELYDVCRALLGVDRRPS